jgi:hypothetical protein
VDNQFTAYNRYVTPRSRSILLVSLMFLVSALGWKSSLAQANPQQYFPDTGHTVSGDFLRAYQSVKDPLQLYGLPITDAFVDAESGRTIQYFQRARFKWYPGNPPELRIQLTPLGKLMYKPGPVVPVPNNFPACKYFTETGNQVCFAFLDFFNANGGVAQFGYPISNFEVHDERIVQYFQLARLEWHPEYPAGQRVTVTDLGKRYFDQHSEDPNRLRASPPDNALFQTVLGLRARAYVQNAFTSSQGTQTVYVMVQDQNRLPVPNAAVNMSIRYPDGVVVQYSLPATDSKGFTQATFPFASKALGNTEVQVTASYGDLRQETVTSFRIWW